VLPVEHLLAQEGETSLELVAGLAAFFVLPVGGDAELGGAVHLPGAYLDFERRAFRPQYFRGERLVHIAFSLGDGVAEHTWDVRPERGDDAERVIALLASVDDDTERDKVEEVAELDSLLKHLVVDAVEMLGAALHLRVNALLLEFLLQNLRRLIHLSLP